MASGAEIGLLPGASAGLAQGGGRRRASCWWRTRSAPCQRVVAALGKMHTVDVEADPQAALLRLGDKRLRPADRQPEPRGGRRPAAVQPGALARAHCATCRSSSWSQPGDEARLLRALDMGVNDYLMRPVDRNELLARVRTQIRRKRHSDHLREQAGGKRRARRHRPADGAAQPALHGDASQGAGRAGERRGQAALAAACRHRPLQVGQRYPRPRRRRQRAARVRRSACAATRAASTSSAASAARSSSSSCPTRRWSGRGRSASACAPASPASRSAPTAPRSLTVTASVGIGDARAAEREHRRGSSKRADQALYAAKRDGRNRVVADAA